MKKDFKKMKVLFVNPPVIEESTLNAQPIPLGVISINQYLRDKGYDCTILNLCDCITWSEVQNRLLFELNVDYVGIPCFTRQRFSVIKLAELIKKNNPNVRLWLGGPHASFLDILLLEKYKYIDFIMRGEGEITTECLIRNVVINDTILKKIDGLTFRNKEGKIIRNKDRKQISMLGKLSVPIQSVDELEELNRTDSLLFHFPNYREENLKIAPIIASRGCNGTCSFCCNRAYWRNQRFVDVEFVKKQLDYYYEKKIIFYDFYDDNFTENKELVFKVAKYIIQQNMDIHWWCSSRVDTKDFKLLKAMKQAGCFMISYGVESGSQIILDNIKKGVKVDDIVAACEIAEKAELDFRVTLSIGHKGENRTTIQETVDLINKIKPKQVALFILKVYPGTPIYRQMIKENKLTEDYWFDKRLPIVPFFTLENSEKELFAFRKLIESSIDANILERYEDELGSVELTLEWGDKNE